VLYYIHIINIGKDAYGSSIKGWLCEAKDWGTRTIVSFDFFIYKKIGAAYHLLGMYNANFSSFRNQIKITKGYIYF